MSDDDRDGTPPDLWNTVDDPWKCAEADQPVGGREGPRCAC